MYLLSMRPYQGEQDLQPIADFLNICESNDQEDHYHSAKNLQAGFAEPGFDPTQNVRLWEDESSKLIAYADLWTPTEISDACDGYLWYRVHPAQRNQGIELDILAWAETRLRAAAATLEGSPDLPIQLWLGCRDNQTERITFFQQQGFEYQRCFLKMERELNGPIATPQLPEGFQIVQAQGIADAPDWVEMYNQTFVDHWNFYPHTVEDHIYWISTPQYRPELHLVALAPDGTYAAFCEGTIDSEYNQHRHRLEGWISSLGTRRGFRRKGLGRAMLLAGLQQLQQAGMTLAQLSVDTENPNAAQTLYESAGFRKVHASFSYRKRIAGGN